MNVVRAASRNGTSRVTARFIAALTSYKFLKRTRVSIDRKYLACDNVRSDLLFHYVYVCLESGGQVMKTEVSPKI